MSSKENFSQGNTLTGFILSKATQSRKESKKKDKKKSKQKDKPAAEQKPTNLLSGALSSVTNIFKPDKGKEDSVETPKQRTSGGATGLAKILTHGFGSLTADTLGLGSGLAAVTNILNQQLKAQSFTATGVQTITSILSDQLENQSSIVSGIKSLRPGRGGGGGGRSLFGSSGKIKGTSSDTLTGYITQKTIEALVNAGEGGIGATLARNPQLLTQPETYAVLIAAIGSYMRMKEVEKMKPFVDETRQQINTENKSEKTPWYQKLGNFFAEQELSSPQGPSNQIGLPVPGSFHSSGAIVNYSSGGMQINKYAGGGQPSMIGEAGKEAVVDLNSRQSRGMFNGSSESKGDPGMKASGASTLAVVDQFVQGMGPLGAPVSQALGPDISNLARTFGMSQTLPNIKIGGGKFKEDGNAKKNRDKFLEDLISGSLEALDAKKKDKTQKNTTTTPPPPPPPPTPPPSNPDKSTPAASTLGPGAGPGSPPVSPSSAGPGAQKPMDGKYKTGSFAPTQGVIGKGGADQVTIENIPGYPQNYVLLNKNDGEFQVWKRRSLGVFPLPPEKDNTVSYAKNENGVYKDPKMRASYNEVRAHILNTGDTALQNQAVGWGYLTKDDIDKWNKKQSTAKVNGNQEKGGRVKPMYDKGGSAVQKPWWDFLGWVTGMKSVEQGKTGVYSNNLMGKMAERTAQTNAAMKELGYQEGGSLFGSSFFNLYNQEQGDIPERVAALEQITAQIIKLSVDNTQAPTETSKKSRAPVATASSFTPMPTNQTSSDLDSAAIVNIVQSQSAPPPLPAAPEGQTTSTYVGDPSGGGLAFAILSSSPWGN